MNQRPDAVLFKRVIAAAWAVTCITIFIVYPARFSVVHGSTLENLPGISAKLGEIPIFAYALDLVLSFLYIVLYSLGCIATGALPVSILLRKDQGSPGTYARLAAILASSFLVGHWLLSTVYLFLAILRQLTPWSVATTLIIAGALGVLPAVRMIRPFKKYSQRSGEKSPEKGYPVIYWLSITILAVALLYSTSRLSYDSVGLYFSDAKLIAMTKQFAFFQGDSFVLSSLQTGIQFSAIIQLFGDQAARMFSWVSGCVMLVLSLAIAEKVGLSSRARAVFLALMLTSTAFTDLLGDGKVDLTSSAIALGAVYWMIEGQGRGRIVLAGFFAGLAVVSRPYNVFLLGAFIVLFYSQKAYNARAGDQERGTVRFLQVLFWIALGGLAPLVVHLLENWAAYGNPLAMLVDAQTMTTGNWQWAFDPRYIWLMRIMYPFVITFLNTSQSIGNISPIFLAFLPNILVGKIRKSTVLSSALIELLIASLVTLFLWITLFFTIMEIRYVFFLWVILFLGMSELVVVVLENNDAVLKRLLPMILIALLGFTLLRTILYSIDTYSPLDKSGNPQCKDFLFCDYLKPINERAQPGERVLSMLAFRYYLRRDLFACSTKMDEYHRLHDASLQSADDFWEEVYRQGYTYVAYEKNYGTRHLLMKFAPAPGNTPAWLQLEPIYGSPGDNVVAYKINVVRPPFPKLLACIRNQNGDWEVTGISTK